MKKPILSNANSQSGYSLIELLVVVAIISALTAIAVPQFAQYRARAFDLRAMEDLRNVALAQEAYFSEHEEYLSCQDNGCSDLPGIARISEGTTLSIEAHETDFTGRSTHPKGSGKVYTWESADGGLSQEN